MASVNLRVTEVNDLSKDGVSNKRIVLVAKTANHDGTGPMKGDPTPFDKDSQGRAAEVDGKLELVVDNATAAKYFTIGSLHTVTIAGVLTHAEQKAAEKKAADDEKAAEKAEKAAAKK
jgi:hypothetical protein